MDVNAYGTPVNDPENVFKQGPFPVSAELFSCNRLNSGKQVLSKDSTTRNKTLENINSLFLNGT